jgi:two-component system nitrate/nitrite sensor histidine kinase NarX
MLLELRPAALIDIELADLLRQLAEAMLGRTRVPVSLAVDGQCALPSDVKIALYRIAQEALNNVAKHAGAKQVMLSLRCLHDRAELVIQDDGRGFTMENISADHLGVGIMHERAASVGATLQIDSGPGRGTRVTAIWAGGREK